LPQKKIIDTAIQIIDRDGADALSFRSLANRLGSSTATLYRHVANKTELINLVFDQILGEAQLDRIELQRLPWDEACRRTTARVFHALSGHGRTAALLAEVVPTGPNAMAAREDLMNVLTAAGFEPLQAARIVATLGHYALGFAIQTPTIAGTDAAKVPGLSQPDPTDYPVTASVADHLPLPLAEEFAFGLDLLIDGLRKQCPRHDP